MSETKHDTIRITVKYEPGDLAGDSSEEPWARTDYFCMTCGKQPVWARLDCVDYYQGAQHICSSCGSTWHLPDSPEKPHRQQDLQRWEALKDSDTPETTAIQAGIEAAWEFVSTLPEDQKEWGDRECSIAYHAACAAVKAVMLAQIDEDMSVAEAQTERVMSRSAIPRTTLNIPPPPKPPR